MKKFDTEVHLSREIVIIGFSVTIVTMAVLAVVLTTLGGRKFVADILETLKE